MNEKLRLLPFQVIEMDNQLLLKRGISTLVIPDPNALIIIRVIQKALTQSPYTGEELAALFAGNTRDLILSFVDHLLKKRFIVPADETETQAPAEDAQDIFYWHFNKHQKEIANQLNMSAWAFVGINKLNKQLISSMLREGKRNLLVVDDPNLRNVSLFDDHWNCTDDFWNHPEIKIIAEDDIENYLPEIGFIVAASEFGSFYLLEAWNTFAVENRIPFYPVVLQNMVGYAGPLVIPNEGACLECLSHRQNSNAAGFQEKRIVEKYAFQTQQVAAYHHAMLNILGETASFDLVKFVNNIQWEIGSLCEVDLLAGSMTRRKLIKAPRCKTCSDAAKSPAINIHKQMTSDEAWKEIEQTVGYEE